MNFQIMGKSPVDIFATIAYRYRAVELENTYFFNDDGQQKSFQKAVALCTECGMCCGYQKEVPQCILHEGFAKTLRPSRVFQLPSLME